MNRIELTKLTHAISDDPGNPPGEGSFRVQLHTETSWKTLAKLAGSLQESALIEIVGVLASTYGYSTWRDARTGIDHDSTTGRPLPTGVAV